MRSWLTTREVRALLGNVSQQRVSQLVRGGSLVVDRDPEGRLRYDRATVERLAQARAVRQATSPEDADERRALHDEARDRFRRERKAAAAEEELRRARHEALAERAVTALERLARVR